MEIINYDNKAHELTMDKISFNGSNPSNYNFITIEWTLLYECNYKCSYCFGQDSINKNFRPLEDYKRAIDKIFSIERKYYNFTLLGGEVTYYPYFLELLEYIYSFDNDERKVSVLLITNGSKSIEYFDKLLSIVQNKYFYFSYSIHLEYEKIEHIKEIIKLLNKYNRTPLIHLMLHPILEEKAKLYFNELYEMRKNFDFDFKISEILAAPDFTKIDERYNKKYLEWAETARRQMDNITSNKTINNEYDKTTYSLINMESYSLACINNEYEKIFISYSVSLLNNLRSYRNFYCCGGVNQIQIDYTGNYRGVSCPLYQIVGNIYEDEFINIYKLTKPVKCTFEQCTCHSNNFPNKYRNENEAKKYIYDYRMKNIKLLLPYLLDKIESMESYDNETEKYDNKIKKIIDTLAWWIPFKKKREEFRAKFK